MGGGGEAGLVAAEAPGAAAARARDDDARVHPSGVEILVLLACLATEAAASGCEHARALSSLREATFLWDSNDWAAWIRRYLLCAEPSKATAGAPQPSDEPAAGTGDWEQRLQALSGLTRLAELMPSCMHALASLVFPILAYLSPRILDPVTPPAASASDEGDPFAEQPHSARVLLRALAPSAWAHLRGTAAREEPAGSRGPSLPSWLDSSALSAEAASHSTEPLRAAAGALCAQALLLEGVHDHLLHLRSREGHIASALAGGGVDAAGAAAGAGASPSAAEPRKLSLVASELASAAHSFLSLAEPFARALSRVDEAEYMRTLPAEFEPPPLVPARPRSAAEQPWGARIVAAAGAALGAEGAGQPADPYAGLPAAQAEAKRSADRRAQAELRAWLGARSSAVRGAAAAAECALLLLRAVADGCPAYADGCQTLAGASRPTGAAAGSAEQRRALSEAARALRAAEPLLLSAAASLPFAAFALLRYGPPQHLAAAAADALRAHTAAGGGAPDVAASVGYVRGAEEAHERGIAAACSARQARGLARMLLLRAGSGSSGSGGSTAGRRALESGRGSDRSGSSDSDEQAAPRLEHGAAPDGSSTDRALAAERAISGWSGAEALWLLHQRLAAATGSAHGRGLSEVPQRAWEAGACVYAIAALTCALSSTRRLNRLASAMATDAGARARGGRGDSRCALAPFSGGQPARVAGAALPAGLGGRAGASGDAGAPAGPRLLVLLSQLAQSAHLPARAHGARALAHALCLLSPALIEWDFALCQFALSAPLSVRELPQLRAALPALPALARAAHAAPTAAATRAAHSQLLALLLDELRMVERRADERREWVRAGTELARALSPESVCARAAEACECALDLAQTCAAELLGARTAAQRSAAAADVALTFRLVDALARSAWPRLGMHSLRLFERALSTLVRAAPLAPAEQRRALEQACARLVRALWLCDEVAVSTAIEVSRAELDRMCTPRKALDRDSVAPGNSSAESPSARRPSVQRQCAREAADAVARVCALALADGAAESELPPTAAWLSQSTPV